MSEALYLYGFVGAGAPDPPATLLGVAGSRVEVVELDGPLRAVCSAVPAEAYAPEKVEERVHDLEWVGEHGALHERIVTWFVDHGGILPVRLLTLYSGPEALRSSVADQAGTLVRQMERLQGLREWDLKVSYNATVLAEHLGEVSDEVAGLDREIEQSSPGKRYLLERRRAQRIGEETSRAARDLAAQLHEKLAKTAREARRLPLPREKGELPVVLNAAYLMEPGREGELGGAAAAEASRLRSLGVEVTLTGPWAPYRFLSENPPRTGGDA
jgi:hypothetical protein